MIASAGVGGGFGGVLGYVLDEKKGAEVVHQQELLAQGEERALLLDEMRMCAEQNLRCTRPVYHLSLSWAPEDHPTPEQVVATAQRFLLDLGLQEHQALVVRHHDTAHEHVHIVVNRVHPDTGKTWKGGSSPPPATADMSARGAGHGLADRSKRKGARPGAPYRQRADSGAQAGR